MSNERFPAEIFDLCIDEVAGLVDPKETLHSCNLVSQSFCHRARQHLFNRVYLRFGKPMETVIHLLPRLQEIMYPEPQIDNLPGVARYIEDVSFVLGLGPDTEDAAQEEDILPFLNNDLFIKTLNMLHEGSCYIKKFVFMISSPMDGLSWSTLDANPQIALLNLIRSPQLDDLSLSGLRNLPPNLLKSTNLTRILIHGLSASQDSPSVNGDEATYPRLKYLNTDHSFSPTPVTSTMISPYRQLKSFVSGMYDIPSLHRTRQLLAENDGSLEYLILSAIVDLHQLEPINFNHFPKLKTLVILPSQYVSPFDDTPRTTHRGLAQVCHTLGGQSIASGLTEFHIYVAIVKRNLAGELEHPAPDSPWLALDASLSGPHFPNLEEVKLSFTVETTSAESKKFDLAAFRASLMPLLSHALPSLCASKTVKLSIEVSTSFG